MVQYGFPVPTELPLARPLGDTDAAQNRASAAAKAERDSGVGSAADETTPEEGVAAAAEGEGESEEWGEVARRSLMDEMFMLGQQRFAREAGSDSLKFETLVSLLSCVPSGWLSCFRVRFVFVLYWYYFIWRWRDKVFHRVFGDRLKQSAEFSDDTRVCDFVGLIEWQENYALWANAHGDVMSATAVRHLPRGACMVDAAVVGRPDHVFMAKVNRVASRTVGVVRNLSWMRPGRCRRSADQSQRGYNRVTRRMSAARCGCIFAARADKVASQTVWIGRLIFRWGVRDATLTSVDRRGGKAMSWGEKARCGLRNPAVGEGGRLC